MIKNDYTHQHDLSILVGRTVFHDVEKDCHYVCTFLRKNEIGFSKEVIKGSLHDAFNKVVRWH